MNLDDFKEPWQQQQHELAGRVDDVLKTVRLRMSWFDRVIWLRDLRESAAAIFVVVCFTCYLFLFSQPLAKAGAALAILWALALLVVLNWARLTGQTARPGMSLQDYCAAELARVDRQIWLLRNINWWYTGPCFLAVSIFVFGLLPDLRVVIFMVAVLVPIGWFIYHINQYSVRHELLPLRQELAHAIHGPTEEEASPPFENLPNDEAKKIPWGKLVLAFCGWLILAGAGAYYVESLGSFGVQERSPFTDIHFEGERAIVTYGGRAYEWRELDGVRIEEIVASSKQRFPDDWEKRISEDLVLVLRGLDHEPGETVLLRLLDLETGKTVFEDAPITKEKRRVIWERRQAKTE